MENFSHFLEQTGEYGEVKEIRSHIAIAHGLPKVKSHEVVVFESGVLGEVFSIERDSVEILVFSKERVRVGEKLTRTGSMLKVPVGEELIGRVVDPLVRPLAGVLGFSKPSEDKEIDYVKPFGISHRARIKTPFLTGVSIVDITLPLGKGQRELVLGDRKTGKSSFLMNIIKNQINLGSMAVYCAIGRKKTDIKRIDEYFRKEKISDNAVIVASSFDDPASMICLSPYTAMTIAEFFRDRGRDVLLVLDDLTTHAKFYREISLLSKRFPGRDSYPGDIFYTHARLLERAGNFKHPEKGEVSITCLPIAETVEDDLGYIVTNLMGMTDGHIFFDSNLYYKGRRPAINISLSVTRVGRQSQSKLIREINREVTAFLASYERVQSFSHFGADLSESIKQILNTGDQLQAFFDQDYSIVVPLEVQLVLLSLIWLRFFSDQSPSKINDIRKSLIDSLEDPSARTMIANLVNVENFNDLLSSVAKKKEEVMMLCKINN